MERVVLDRDVRLVASTGEKTAGGENMSKYASVNYDEAWMRRIDEEVIDLGYVSVNYDEAWMRRIDEEVIDLGGGGGGGDSDSGGASKEQEPEAEPMGLADWVREGEVRLSFELAEPPAISTVSLHLPATPSEIAAQLQGVKVVCSDKNLLVLTTGPKFSSYASSGLYLVFDAERKEEPLLVAPSIDWSKFAEKFGPGPAILRHGQRSDFTLAVVVVSEPTGHVSLLRWSPSTDKGAWVEKEVSLPTKVLQLQSPFWTDVSFAFQGHWACWVDLCVGLVAIDVLSDDLDSWFAPLPDDHRQYSRLHTTMGCVNGAIKFLAIDGHFISGDKLSLITWALQSGTPCEWKRDGGNGLLGDLWAEIPELKMRPQVFPMCPLLSPAEDDTASFFLSDIDDEHGHITTKGEYVLLVNTRSNRVLSCRKCPVGRSLQLIPSLTATEFRT